MKKINIAIDGFSSTGKSTLARQLAAKLGYTYIDSGAMYRAVTLYFLQNHIDISKPDEVAAALTAIKLVFFDNKISLNGKVLDAEIRKMEVSNLVSEVAALEAVRKFLVSQQQAMGVQKGVVMDGRDIGTKVFPDAALKIFLTAQESIRIHRRFEELNSKDSGPAKHEVAANLKHRDEIDSTREFSPLQKSDDALVLDNSELSMAQQLEIAFGWAMDHIQH